MSQNFQPGDFLVFQLEAGFALLRLLEIETSGDSRVWHVAAYDEFFPDVESAESAAENPASLGHRNAHIALTTRAFESTQVARLGNAPLAEPDLDALRHWQNDPERLVADRSVRLMLGLR